MNRWLSLLFLFAASAPSLAQSTRTSDSLLHRGIIDRAESGYYAAARAHPHDPEARFALGRYLVSRGALRAGATLIEEAMQFGLDKGRGGEALAPVYMELGEYQKLAALPGSPLSPGEKELVRWLVAHPSRVVSPDSSVLVAFTRTTAEGYLGAVRIRINGRPVLAMVAPRGNCGLRLADTSTIAAALHRFPSGETGLGTPAAADSIGYGRLTISNVPVVVERLRGAQAVICLGGLLRYAPTFDPKANLMTLRLGGAAPAAPASSTNFPFLDAGGQFAIVQGGGWAPLVLPQIAMLMRDRRWTLDARRGVITIDP
jgi:hypothetical protein